MRPQTAALPPSDSLLQTGKAEVGGGVFTCEVGQFGMQVLVHLLVGVVDFLGDAGASESSAGEPPQEQAHTSARHQPLQEL